MSKLSTYISAFMRDEEGQDIIEYGLLAAFIAIVVAAILTLFAPELETIYTAILGQLQAAADAAGG